LKDLPWFARQLVNSAGGFRAALLVVAIIFDPDALAALRRTLGEQRPVGEAPGHLIEGDADELTATLAAALQNGLDVTVLFEPARLAIFADHDEYTTIFSSSPLGELKEQLTARGVKLVDYHRDTTP